MSAELKRLAEAAYTAACKHRYNTSDFSREDAANLCAFEEATSPDAILALIKERDALREALKDLLDDVGKSSSLPGAVKARAALALVGDKA